ncbi:MAG TPA: glycosyltransferase family 4 protein [Myxococcaceae bacterium]|nr:glycosyltransferase family 4 protein [Myxococcaceae bacterium]
MKGLRLAYVLNTFPKLSETFIAEELAELVRRGVEVLVLSLNRPKETIRHRLIDEAGLTRRTRYDVAAFAQELRGFRPHLLHAHFATQPTAAAREMAQMLHLPFTFTAHGYHAYERPPADFRERASTAAAVVTVSRAVADHLHSALNVPRDRLWVVPSGVDIERFHPGEKPSGFPRVVCVARLKPVKNLVLLLHACRLLLDRGVEFHCTIVGDGPDRADLQTARVRFGLSAAVTLVGAADQERVAELWRQASVGALSSVSEGMPVSLMEAAASGVPVVAPRVGGIPELVQDGETGLLFDSGDAPAMASALQTLLTQPETREAMGAKGRERVVEHFSVRHQVDALVALWSGVLEKGRGSGHPNWSVR